MGRLLLRKLTAWLPSDVNTKSVVTALNSESFLIGYSLQIEFVVAIGGGKTADSGKATADALKIDVVVVPTSSYQVLSMF